MGPPLGAGKFRGPEKKLGFEALKARKKLDSPKENAADFCHGSVGNKYFSGKTLGNVLEQFKYDFFWGAGAIFLMYMQTFD